MTLLLTGGTGLIGKHLGLELTRQGHKIVGLTRDKKRALLEAPYPATWIECDIGESIPDLSGYSLDGVFHLAGENVGEKSWSASQKEKIKTSRTRGTDNLCRAVLKLPSVVFFIGASAIGYYGSTQGDDIASEDTTASQDFLAEVTQSWEAASQPLAARLRLVLFRIGVVLTTEGGALPKMLFPARVFASSSLGSGRQWMSWVHLNDVVSAFLYAMKRDNLRGVYNLVAPHSAQQKDMAREIAVQLDAPKGPPVPGFVIHTMLGEQGSLALMSLRVSSAKLEQVGFHFEYPTLDQALSQILRGWQEGASIKTFRQYFPEPRQRVFDFFSGAHNLEHITPSFLNFHILNMSTPHMQAGTLLEYKLRIHGIPIHWRTRIETWNPHSSFSDVQLKGPYSLWHHTHRFEDLGGGTLMTDEIRYRVPLGRVGRLASQAFVDKDIDRIFGFRRDVIEKFF